MAPHEDQEGVVLAAGEYELAAVGASVRTESAQRGL